MKKIPTIFERDWDGNRKVIHKYVVDFDFESAIATEKVDGTNVRITIRSGTAVRVEKRCNPSKIQKHKGIEEPWYIDASEGDPNDKWIFDALNNTNLKDLPDGEWSGECFGKNVQGNPLEQEENKILFFSLGQAPILDNVPTDYDSLKDYLRDAKSKINPNVLVEGIVWHHPDGRMCKIKRKDFHYQ